MKNTSITIPNDKITSFCSRWKIASLELFGSALRDDFGADSDIDFLYTYEPDAKRGMLELVRMERELSEILGRKVDMLSRNAVERSNNRLRRSEILNSAKIVYVSR